MTENKGDLISREALKKAVINNFDNLQAYFPKDFIEEIDNAPTVAEDYDTGYQDGLEDGLNDIRPQGKWLFTEVQPDYTVKGQCSICKERTRIGNYCRICGADMRGKEE